MVHQNSKSSLAVTCCVQWQKCQGFRYKQLKGTLRPSEREGEDLCHLGGVKEPLLLHIKKSQLRWHQFVCSGPVPPRRGRGENPGTCWGNCTSPLAWEHLGIPLVELEEGRGRGKSGHPCSDSYPGNPALEKAEKTDRFPVSNASLFFQTLWWTNDHLLNAKGPDGAFSRNTNFQALLCFGKYQSNVTKHIKFSAFSLENGLKHGMRQYFVQTRKILPTDSLHGAEPNASWGLFLCVCSAV